MKFFQFFTAQNILKNFLPQFLADVDKLKRYEHAECDQ